MIRQFVVLTFLLSSVAFPSKRPPLIPRKVLFGNPERMLPQVSPDGKMLAWIMPSNNVLNVWVRGISEAANSARPLTRDPKRGIRQFFWQEDSQHLIYLQDHDGDENWHLFQVSARGEGTAPRDLTPVSCKRESSRNLQSFRTNWSSRSTNATPVFTTPICWTSSRDSERYSRKPWRRRVLHSRSPPAGQGRPCEIAGQRSGNPGPR